MLQPADMVMGGPLFIDQSPPAGANITKLKFTALSPYVHLSEITLAGKDNQFWITKKLQIMILLVRV